MTTILCRLIKGPSAQLLLIILFLLTFFSLPQLSGQNDSSVKKRQKSEKPGQDISLFGNDRLLNISITLDLSKFMEKPSKSYSFDAVMTIYMSETNSLNKKVTINYRGTKRYEICSFPPMQLNFKNPIHSDSSEIKKLKLVTNCEQNSIGDEYVLREYLVYKMFNVLTDSSFRVRLLKVSYIDKEKVKKTITRYGFFIEPIDIVAKRTNSTVVKSLTLDQRHIVPEVMDRLAIFNYMVSNWDWSVPGQHNVAIIKPSGINSETGLAIPYDFDLTGVVNANYAIPPPDLKITNVRERLFSGTCRSREIYMDDLKRFISKKENLYSVVDDFPYLNQRSKKDITYFLDQFFDQLTKQRNLDYLIEIFLTSCKKQ